MTPLYLLSVDAPPERAIVLVIRTSEEGRTTGKLELPEWEELPPAFDGPHAIETALELARSYADAYGYRAIHVDIESSQLWRPEWGELER